MSINDIKPPNMGITGTVGTIETTGVANTAISQVDMNLRVISAFQVASYLFIVIGLIVGISYMIKSKKKAIHKIISMKFPTHIH